MHHCIGQRSVFRSLLQIQKRHSTFPSAPQAHLPRTAQFSTKKSDIQYNSSRSRDDTSYIDINNNNNNHNHRVVGSSVEAVEETLSLFYGRLSSQAATTTGAPAAHPHPHPDPDIHQWAQSAMELCLARGKAEEALDVYLTLCSCGVVTDAARCSSDAVSHRALIDLALDALQQLPHRVQDWHTLHQLMEAELEGEPLMRRRTNTISTVVQQAAPSSSSSYSYSYSPCTAPVVSAVELFRVSLHQNIEVLRSTQRLHLPFGRNFLFSEALRVLESAALRAQVEVTPLTVIASRLLAHPFTYKVPSLEWAKQACTYTDDLGIPVLTSSVLLVGGRSSQLQHNHNRHQPYINVSHERRLRHLETDMRPLRAAFVGGSTLHFLCAMAPEWDALFLRRVAETLVLPADVHDVFSRAYRAKRYRRQRQQQQRRRIAQAKNNIDQCFGVDADDTIVTCCSTWTHAEVHQLFPTCSHSSSSSSTHYGEAANAYARLERILRRRVHHDILVPDAAYVLDHLPQLRQMARHREVVLTHGTLLRLVRRALGGRGGVVGTGGQRSAAGRFHARRVLLALMESTTTTAHTRATGQQQSPHTRNASGGGGGGGITILGLQDELTLLDSSRERHVSRDDDDNNEGSAPRHGGVGDNDAADEEAGMDSSVVLVAKQLERALQAHARGMTFADAVVDCAWDAANIVEGIILTGRGEGEEEDSEGSFFSMGTPPRRLRPAPAGVVVVATTSARTRTMAYMLGLQTFPPTHAASQW